MNSEELSKFVSTETDKSPYERIPASFPILMTSVQFGMFSEVFISGHLNFPSNFCRGFGPSFSIESI